MDSFLGEKTFDFGLNFLDSQTDDQEALFFDNDVDLEITRFLDSNELLDKGVKKPVLEADDAKNPRVHHW